MGAEQLVEGDDKQLHNKLLQCSKLLLTDKSNEVITNSESYTKYIWPKTVKYEVYIDITNLLGRLHIYACMTKFMCKDECMWMNTVFMECRLWANQNTSATLPSLEKNLWKTSYGHVVYGKLDIDSMNVKITDARVERTYAECTQDKLGYFRQIVLFLIKREE